MFLFRNVLGETKNLDSQDVHLRAKNEVKSKKKKEWKRPVFSAVRNKRKERKKGNS
jgi:hypothetical protein